MECNRDEALRAKEIAEKKLAVQDYASALKFAHKAQQLFPGLENLSQMLAVIDVQVAAQVKLNGTEVDWYRVLQVDATADEMLIKRQYKKLALLLHPDKNKFVGAEAAFKLIGEASQILCDKPKRILHDMKRGVLFRGGQNVSVSQHTQNVQTSHSNGQYYGMNSQGMSYANGQYPRMPPQAPSQTLAFWTACPSCQMRFQYLRTYENQNLLCPHCRLPFVAKDINSMQGNGASGAYGCSPHYGSQQQQDFSRSFSKTCGTGFSSSNGFVSGVKVDSFHTDIACGGGFATTVPPAGTKTTEEYVQHVYEKANRERDKADAERKQKRKRQQQERKDKVLKKVEREQLGKAKDEERTGEAMDRLMMKKKERADKAAVKDKKRRLKKHRSDSSSSDEEEDEEDETLEDMLSDDQELVRGDNTSGYLRRSSRSRRNVIYKVESDDEDLEGFPASMKARGVSERKELNDGAGSGGASATGVKSTVGASESQMQSEAQNNFTKKLADFAKNAIREKLNLRGMKSGGTSDSYIQGTKRVDAGKEGRPLMTPVNKHEEREEKTRGSVAGVAEMAPSERKGPIKDGADELQEKELDADDSTGLPVSLEEPEPESYSVPDADFHDFDKDREEKDIKAGQIWALYDDQDGMPRYYIRVKDVSFYSGFEANITWLEPRNPSSDQIKLSEADFACACGDFKTAKSQVMDSVNSFSHIVKWVKGPKGSIRIYPSKGDIWGLYQDWVPGQKTVKVDDAPFKYNMVEVVTEYNEQNGLVVKPLVKVTGFRTLFQQSKEPTLQISVAELLRFSHQVLAYKLTGDEAQGVPQGCWELDPASVPSDLISPGRVELDNAI